MAMPAKLIEIPIPALVPSLRPASDLIFEEDGDEVSDGDGTVELRSDGGETVLRVFAVVLARTLLAEDRASVLFNEDVSALVGEEGVEAVLAADKTKELVIGLLLAVESCVLVFSVTTLTVNDDTVVNLVIVVEGVRGVSDATKNVEVVVTAAGTTGVIPKVVR